MLAPLILSGEGNYALSVIKEVEVTDDFLGLQLPTRKCQNDEKYEDCTTRVYLQKIQNHCNCVPYQLRNFTIPNQVILLLLTFSYHFCHLQVICFGSDNECAKNITIDTTECIKPCEGIYADVTKYDADKIDDTNYEALLESYHKYKRFFNQTKPGI